MLTGQDLIQEIMQVHDEMDEAVKDCREEGKQLANYERDYRQALALEMVSLRENYKTPVTIIADMARGNPQVSALKHKRDMAEALYYAAKESLQVKKRKHDMLKEIWGREGR